MGFIPDMQDSCFTIWKFVIVIYHTKKKIKDEDIVYNLKKSTTLPLYTNGHKILKKEEVQDWILPGINPDINCINPLNCYEEDNMSKIECNQTHFHVENNLFWEAVNLCNYLN